MTCFLKPLMRKIKRLEMRMIQNFQKLLIGLVALSLSLEAMALPMARTPANALLCADIMKRDPIVSAKESKRQKLPDGKKEDEDAAWVRSYKLAKERLMADPTLTLGEGDHQRSDVILAFLESKAERMGFQMKVSDHVDHLEWQSYSTEALIRLSGKKTISSRKMEKIIRGLFEPAWANRKTRLKRNIFPRTMERIQDRVAVEMLANELIVAFKDLGLNISENSRKNFLQRMIMGGGYRWASLWSLNALTVPWHDVVTGGGTVPLLLLPKAKFEDAFRLPEELQERIRQNGFEAEKENVLKYLKIPAHASWMWNVSSYVFYAAVLLMFLDSMTAEEQGLFAEAWSYVTKKDHDAQQVPSQLSSILNQNQLLNSWAIWREELTGSAPTPAEIEAQRRIFLGTPKTKGSDR